MDSGDQAASGSEVSGETTQQQGSGLVEAIKDQYKAIYDRNHTPVTLVVGDMVFVHYSPEAGSSKLESNWRGPYKVVEVIQEGDNNYYHVMNARYDRPMRCHISRLRKARVSADNLDSESIFWASLRPGTDLVDEILDHAGSGKRLAFLVKWSGWDRLYATWQPAITLSKVTVATQYAATHKLKISEATKERVRGEQRRSKA